MKLSGRLKTVMVAFAGFVLGALSFHTSALKAQSSGAIHVTQIPVSGVSSALTFASGTIIGFSCVPSKSDTSDGFGSHADGICYIATR